MDCTIIRELMAASLDASLNEAEQALLAEHVRTCPECAAELGSLQAVMCLVRDLPEVEPPVNFREQLYRRIAVEAETKQPSLWVTLLDWVRQRTYRGLATGLASVLILFFSINGIVAVQSGYPLVSLAPDRTVEQHTEAVPPVVDDGATRMMLTVPEPAAESTEAAPGMDYGLKSAGSVLAPEYVTAAPAEPDRMGPLGALSAGKGRSDYGATVVMDRGANVVHQVRLTVAVADLAASQTKVQELTAKNNGAVAVITYLYDAGNVEQGRAITLQVPEEMFLPVLKQIESLGKVTAKEVDEISIDLDAATVENRVRNIEQQLEVLSRLREKETDPTQIVALEKDIKLVDNELLFNRMALGTLRNAQVELVLTRK